MVPYMIIPLGLTDEEEHIYSKLYKKCDFATMQVKYTISQLVADSYGGFELTTKKVRRLVKVLSKKGYISEIAKGSKGNPTVYKITKIQDLIQGIYENEQIKDTSMKNISEELIFNEIWNLYPRKKGKTKVKGRVLKLLKKISKK